MRQTVVTLLSSVPTPDLAPDPGFKMLVSKDATIMSVMGLVCEFVCSPV